MKEQLEIKKTPQTIEEAVKIVTEENDKERGINYLKNHPEDIDEFCLQTFEAYQPGDTTGILQLGFIIKELLKEKKPDITPKIDRDNRKVEDFIEFDKEVTSEEAVKMLCNFHKVDPRNVLDAFPELNNFKKEDGSVIIFTKTVNGSVPCISMRGYDKEKKFKFSSLINENTGHPMEHVS